MKSKSFLPGKEELIEHNTDRAIKYLAGDLPFSQHFSGGIVDTATFEKNIAGDDIVNFKFTDGRILTIRANFVYNGADEEFNTDFIECQLDVRTLVENGIKDDE